MASLKLKLSEPTQRRLADAARGAGVTPERMAELLLEAWTGAGDDDPEAAPSGVGEPAPRVDRRERGRPRSGKPA